jgi:hypothetical protein
VVMLYKLHTARTCGVVDPFLTSNPSGIAVSRKGAAVMLAHEHQNAALRRDRIEIV